MSWRSLTRIQAGSFSGTQMIFSSGPFSSAMWNTPTTRPRMRQPGKRRLADEDERVQRIAVAAERALDEPVVRRVRHRREEAPVEDDGAELLVELVLVPRARRHLHEDDDGLGHALRLIDLDGGEGRERFPGDRGVDLVRNAVVARGEGGRIGGEGTHGVRLEREAQIHDLDLVAARGREVQHLPPGEQVDRPSRPPG